MGRQSGSPLEPENSDQEVRHTSNPFVSSEDDADQEFRRTDNPFAPSDGADHSAIIKAAPDSLEGDWSSTTFISGTDQVSASDGFFGDAWNRTSDSISGKSTCIPRTLL